MKTIISLISTILFVSCLSLTAQTPEFDELDFEMDSTKSTYKPTGKNYTVIRSKRGNSGVNKTPMADAVLSSEVTEIVLVYTESNPDDMAEREDANRERWENLLKTYPELFQFSTGYKNVCQCKSSDDPELLKKVQGFYVYINGALPKINEPKAIPDPEVTETPVVKKTQSEPAKETPQPEKKVEKAKETVAREPLVEPVKESVKEPESTSVSQKEDEKEAEASEEIVKVKPKTKPAVAKPRKAKDPKACRPPCFQGGDDDLNSFFKDQITLSKKQKRQGKKMMAVVRIQLNFDGTIKKTFVTGADEILNQQIIGALNLMGTWNPAVKAGVTVKSEVKITLKYDKENKCVKPSEITIAPRPAPKCKCVSDEEMFGSSD